MMDTPESISDGSGGAPAPRRKTFPRKGEPLLLAKLHLRAANNSHLQATRSRGRAASIASGGRLSARRRDQAVAIA